MTRDSDERRQGGDGAGVDEGAKDAVQATPAPQRRRDRVGLLGWLVRITAAALVYGLVVALTLPGVFAGPWSWTRVMDLIEMAFFPERPPPAPPGDWHAAARPGDLLTLAQRPVAYWGDPKAPYGGAVTKRAKAPVAIIVHFTDETPAATLVAYGHRPDPNRGNAAYGYHFYIDRAGRVLQGAPLAVRTNHIKPSHASERIGGTKHLDGSNTIGISLVGACRSPRLSPVTYRCSEDTPTTAQVESGLAVIAALQQRFTIPCAAVWGHGELQTDRKSFEGATLTQRHRSGC